MKNQIERKNVLISVYNKKNIFYLSKELIKRNFKIFATTGTFKFLKKKNIQVYKLSDYTQFPEILKGRVKTVHPKIFGGILKNNTSDIKEIEEHKIILFDLVISNFYPFEKIIEKNTNNVIDIMEYIDIGGPAIVRAAGKNYANVLVVVEIKDYEFLIQLIQKYMCIQNKNIPEKIRLNFAIKAFKYTQLYDKSIHNYLLNRILVKKKKISDLPEEINLIMYKKKDLRYGENPHQQSSLYIESKNILKNTILNTQILQGKSLSYNNILDCDVALDCIENFVCPTCIILKHGNPCAVATNKCILQAYKNAFLSDPISSFGGVIIINEKLNSETAQFMINNQFLEVLLVPDIDEESIKILYTKPNIRVLKYNKEKNKQNIEKYSIRNVRGGFLIQNNNYSIQKNKLWKVVTNRKPTNHELQDAIFAFKISMFVKSNAIVYAKNNQTIAIGAGQMSRIDSVLIANMKAKNNNISTNNAIMASDAFFPFKDVVDSVAEKGISCIIQPGGSIQDDKSIESANKNNIAMIFTNFRCFKH
ncbi:bifunctional phosphoribosylaminoimidazolecarboxamide formyltransferase/IMP cyclohydrolase [Buchnera aphidicola (Kurisakia onigurumii)]|uniref:bifunctional phosphoribosylaminoimidazolecarboxamide formyltransferase/IMP cyclohydrolase n=1 Tax=Buchnera aphidicola TaxID=9 RepID=UPI0031B6E6F5